MHIYTKRVSLFCVGVCVPTVGTFPRAISGSSCDFSFRAYRSNVLIMFYFYENWLGQSLLFGTSFQSRLFIHDDNLLIFTTPILKKL